MFFCCKICETEFRNMIDQVKARTGWSTIDEIKIQGDQRSRLCTAFSGNNTYNFTITFNSQGGIRTFEVRSPSQAWANCRDDQTRFWIAQEVADTKFTADIRPLFNMGKKVAGKQPRTLITDGAPNFHEAYEQEFWTAKKGNRTEHIREITLDGVRHNNKMERMNGEIRDRERVMRTLEKSDSPILAGYQLFHNYIRPHTALKGKTPAEVAGIHIEGANKWTTIIQNARMNGVKT